MLEEAQTITQLKKQKAEVSSQIKVLEETPKAKLSPIWMTLVYIISIACGGVAFFDVKNFIWAMGALILAVAAGITQLLIVKRKNKNLEKELLKLRTEEKRLTALINGGNHKSVNQENE